MLQGIDAAVRGRACTPGKVSRARSVNSSQMHLTNARDTSIVSHAAMKQPSKHAKRRLPPPAYNCYLRRTADRDVGRDEVRRPYVTYHLRSRISFQQLYTYTPYHLSNVSTTTTLHPFTNHILPPSNPLSPSANRSSKNALGALLFLLSLSALVGLSGARE